MSILKELLELYEAEVPVELQKLVASYPTHHGKAIEKLWGGSRLVWHGERFFDHDDLGPAYKKAEEAALQKIDDGITTSTSVPIDATHYVADIGKEDEETGHADVEWEVEFERRDVQECYLGYDPKKDKLYIGFDAGVGEEGFNDAFDDAFEEATGESFDMDNSDHYDIYEASRSEFNANKLGFWGLLFEITNHDGHYEAEEIAAFPDGFYKGVYPGFKRAHKDVVDLRLD